MTIAYPKKLNQTLGARDILNYVVSDRELHLTTINSYRYNEQHSCKELTAEIEKLNGKPRELVQDLSRHVADEARHAMWLTDLLVDLGFDIGKPAGMSYIDEFERLIDWESYESPEHWEDRLIASLAAINVTEKRGCEYFSAHIYALKAAPQTEENIKIRQTIERIFPEEAAHVRWGNQQLAKIAAQSPEHRQKVEQAKRKYIAIEQAAFEFGMDIMLGAELRGLKNLLQVANTLPVWQRPQYLMQRLPQTLLAPDLQMSRFHLSRQLWERDPQEFMEKFVPMIFKGWSSIENKQNQAAS